MVLSFVVVYSRLFLFVWYGRVINWQAVRSKILSEWFEKPLVMVIISSNHLNMYTVLLEHDGQGRFEKLV